MGKPKNFEKSQHCWLSSWRGSIDDRVICPYNPKHVMQYHRLALHIIRCAQKHLDLAAEFVTCPYNSLHRGPKDEAYRHLQNCHEHQMSVFSRVASGKQPYIQVYNSKPKDEIEEDMKKCKIDDKTVEMLRLEAEWEELL